MPGLIFQGRSTLALDAKGRVTVPARQRALLDALCGGAVTLTRNPAGCVNVFPRPTWEGFRARLLELPLGAEGWRRVYLGSAQDVQIDAGARMLVSPELRDYAGLERGVVLLGNGALLELWDAARLDAHEAATMAIPMPEALKGIVF